MTAFMTNELVKTSNETLADQPIAWKIIYSSGHDIVEDFDKVKWALRNHKGAKIIPLFERKS